MSKLRQKILAAQDIRSEIVRIDAWDTDIEVRGMTGEQRGRLSEAATGENGVINNLHLIAGAIIECAFDPETKEQIFGPADRDAILQKAGDALDVLGGAALRLSGMTEDAKQAIRKNSNAASDGSTSDSPSPST